VVAAVQLAQFTPQEMADLEEEVPITTTLLRLVALARVVKVMLVEAL
jgi:hypothetical protein